jgi:surface protein
VMTMSYMFHHAKKFNKDISEWKTSSVLDMSYMFFGADDFKQDISRWNMSNVEITREMF